MFESMKNVYITNNTNQIFVKAMLPYQEGLLRISECLLRDNICSELILITQKFIDLTADNTKALTNLFNYF